MHDAPDIVARESFSRADEDEGDEAVVTADRVRFNVRDLSRQIAREYYGAAATAHRRETSAGA